MKRLLFSLFYASAQQILRRHICAKRAELILSKHIGGNWGVKFYKDRIRAINVRNSSHDWFSYSSLWAEYDISVNGDYKVNLGSGEVFIPLTGCDCIGAITLEERRNSYDGNNLPKSYRLIAEKLRVLTNHT